MKKNSIMAVFIIVLISFSYYLLSRSDSARSQNNDSEHTATVFVHGYKGTLHSFQSMLYRFEHEYGWGKKSLICRVTKEGNVLVTEPSSYDANDNVFIQVHFESNRASFKDTSYWLSKVMYVLKEKYDIGQMNIVSHSMGGLITTKYLEDYSKDSSYPKVKKFIAIGSPFNGLKNRQYLEKNNGEAKYDLMPNSKALQDLYKHRKDFPTEVEVYAIAGTGDQLVTVKSAQALEKIVPASNYKETIIDDRSISHSGLHESVKVDRLVGNFLWNN
ncbi:putative alpha/beta hydrolase family protein [Bacillus ectoiniformans]|uniref:alpha/beta fold hydrolase n=1 Tax=Bacillus ectoiniformans TaxID=1494429 RepID=UPI00195E82DB|nr:alpha/beta fold hydrolase [Bacillus ectoiniformans]MBM7648289.1 putative alpha/beta hydrolase family protein [Bacillus ectoiniformans]